MRGSLLDGPVLPRRARMGGGTGWAAALGALSFQKGPVSPRRARKINSLFGPGDTDPTQDQFISGPGDTDPMRDQFIVEPGDTTRC